MVDVMNERTSDMTELIYDKLGTNDSVTLDVCPIVSLCGLDIICETSMGYKLSEENRTRLCNF